MTLKNNAGLWYKKIPKLPRKNENYPEKNLPKIKKFLPRGENLPIHAVKPLSHHVNGSSILEIDVVAT